MAQRTRISASRSAWIVACAASLLAGCGSSSSSTTATSTPAGTASTPATTASTPATTASTPASGAPTTAQATAVANAVNLTAADVPGFTGTAHVTRAADMQNAAQLAACDGGVDPTRRIVDIHSNDFHAGTGLQIQQVASSVVVHASPSLVMQDVAAVGGTRGRSCIVSYFDRAIRRSSASSSLVYGPPAIQALPTPQGASGGSVGYRVVLPATVSGTRLTFYVDFLGFGSGRALVALTATRIGQPFATADEQRLYSLLLSRANAQHG